jgi:hypothetical protein
MPQQILGDDEPIVRGDSRDLLISGLVDQNLNPTTFAPTDVIRFTMKRHRAADALIEKTSDDGGITFTPATDEATIHLYPSDFDAFPDRDLPFWWDVELVSVDVPTRTVTIAYGTGTVFADVTGA